MSRKSESRLFVPVILLLVFSLLSISVGFSSLSTTLTVNGTTAFAPVDMLRVTKIELDSINGATEDSSSHTINSINALLDIDSLTGYATYNVTVSNLGQVDKILSSITNEIFSNDVQLKKAEAPK